MAEASADDEPRAIDWERTPDGGLRYRVGNAAVTVYKGFSGRGDPNLTGPELPQASTATSTIGLAHVTALLGSPALLGSLWGSRNEARLTVLEISPQGPRVNWTTKGCCTFKWDDAHPKLDLPDVFAFRAYGGVRHLAELELCRWRELLDYRAGLLDRQPLPVVLPDTAPKAAQLVGLALGHLMGLRDPDHWPPDEPFVFTFAGWAEKDTGLIGFGAAYASAVTGETVHPDVIYDGLRWLRRKGFVANTGEKAGRAALRQLLPAALGEVGLPADTTSLEAERTDMDGVGGRRGGHFTRGQELVGAGEPAAELLHHTGVADAISARAGQLGTTGSGATVPVGGGGHAVS